MCNATRRTFGLRGRVYGVISRRAAAFVQEPHVMEKGSRRLSREKQEVKDVKRRLSNLDSAHRALQQQVGQYSPQANLPSPCNHPLITAEKLR